MRRHEETIANNKTYIFSTRRKIHAQEENHGSKMEIVMETLFNHKTQIESLEARCQTLDCLMANLTMSPRSSSSNYIMYCGYKEDKNKEEELVIWMPREVDEMDQVLKPPLKIFGSMGTLTFYISIL